jgi:hypothetical protein
MPKRFPRPTYGSVTATLALFAALGGTSYAALTVTGANIKNGSLTGADIRDGSLKGRDVRNRSLTGADVRDGSLLAADFGAGELPAGAAGPAGPQGPAGPGALTDVVARRVEVALGAQATVEGTATCAEGEFAVGGGAGYDDNQDAAVAILVSEPLDANGDPPTSGQRATAWRAFARNVGPNNRVVNVHVLCAKG